MFTPFRSVETAIRWQRWTPVAVVVYLVATFSALILPDITNHPYPLAALTPLLVFLIFLPVFWYANYVFYAAQDKAVARKLSREERNLIRATTAAGELVDDSLLLAQEIQTRRGFSPTVALLVGLGISFFPSLILATSNIPLTFLIIALAAIVTAGLYLTYYLVKYSAGQRLVNKEFNAE